jgi:hypothetical protein
MRFKGFEPLHLSITKPVRAALTTRPSPLILDESVFVLTHYLIKSLLITFCVYFDRLQ